MSTAARRASSAKSRADAAAAKVDDVQAQIQNLEADLTDELHALHAEWQGKAANIVPVEITAKRTQIRVTDLRLVWIPVA
jgi:phage host-nuclease inhibitor protein Gam